MSVKSATRASKLTVQPLPLITAEAPVGSLPSIEQVRPEVPEVVTQGESYFSRDSIGSAKFDSRMDFPTLPTNATLLSRPINAAGRASSISPQRPCAIASVDIFNSPGTDREKTDRAINETLEVSDFNYKLLESDYDYIYESLASADATAPIIQDLESVASSNFSKVEAATSAISTLASAREDFSRNLDIRLSWENVSQKASEFYSTFSTKFGDGQGEIGLSSIGINPQTETGTAIVDRVKALVTRASAETTTSTAVGDLRVGLSRGYFAVDQRVSNADLLFDDGQISDYSSLSRLQKVAACSEFLSRVFTDTFTGMTGSAQIDLPTVYSGSYIFEPQRIRRGNVTIPSHYDGIIDPTIRAADVSVVEAFRSSIVKRFNDSYESSKMKSGVEVPDEAGSPLDIYLRLIGKIKDSFPTLYASVETGTLSNQAEIYDAVNLLFSMKQSNSTRQFNGFMRGTLLTTLLDPDYSFAASKDEEYDSVNESKSEIEDSGADVASRTVKAKSGFKALASKTLTEESDVLVSSVFNYPERLRNFPAISHGYTKALLTKIDGPWPVAGAYGQFSYLVPTFDYYGEDISGLSTAPEYEGFSKNAPRAKSIPASIKQTLPQGKVAGYNDGSGNVWIYNLVAERISTFGRDDTGKTVANAILDFYDELLSLFEDAYGKKLDEVSPEGVFYTREKTCTKRAIVDVILECMGNLISYFLKPGYISDVTSPAATTIAAAAAGSSERGKTTAAGSSISPVDSTWYLGVNESYYESLTFCESISQISGDLNTAIATAYANSKLSATSDASFLSDVLSTILSDLYPRHRGTRIAISSIAAISNIVDTASQNFSKSVTDASQGISTLPADLKTDVLNSLTTEVASSILLKAKFESGVRQSLEESLVRYDTDAARWFYKNYKQDLSTSKVCAVIGLPSGFSSELSTSEIQVKGNTAASGNLPMTRGLSKYKLTVSSRSIKLPYDNITPLIVGKFHPFLHVYITSKIAENLLPLEIASTGAASIMCFDRVTSTWVEVDYDDCVEFLSNGGSFGVSGDVQDSSTLSKSEVEDIIEFHVLDAVLKSTIRVVCGVNFDSMSLSSPAKSIDAVAAAKMLTLFSSADPNIIPRGGLSSSDYLSAQSDGSFLPIPFSSLAGESPGLTDPSTHSLLLKLLGSGVFTAGGVTRRVVTPPAFERVYCFVYDPSRMISSGQELDSSATDISLFSIGVLAE